MTMVRSASPAASSLGEYGCDVPVDVAHAVQIIVVTPTPAGFLVGNFAYKRIVRTQEIAVRRRPPRRVEWVRVIRRKVEGPLFGV